MNLLSISNIILTLLPVVSDTVKNVEALQGQGNGQAKLQLALAIIKPIYEATNPPQSFDSIVGHVTAVIGALVNFYNQIHAFTTTAKAA